mmetsp:Transcript_122136/g.346225  ORF Transcript_122136/g.346225 Transcript_122136/m.346225 type:complete len:335 (+) Transcript_122136:107-1111(+)
MRGLPRGPGPWTPQLSTGGRDRFNQPQGPTNLDMECKSSLQQLLKPCNYAVIVPWMQTSGAQAKKDMVTLARYASTSDAEAADPNRAFANACQQVQVNRKGRPRCAGTVSCTPDRAQSDLLRNRSGADKRDANLQGRRKALESYASVPTTETIADYYRLRDEPLRGDASTQVLTEGARRSLQRWQLNGPERDAEGAAQAMRSLRSISNAVAALPTYADHNATQTLAGQSRRDSLFEYSKVAPKGARCLKQTEPPRRPLGLSSSMPAIHRPLIDPKDIENVYRPGGFVVHLNDHAPLAMLKNRERATKSKISLNGGQCDWSTTAEAMGQQLALES